MGGADIKYCIKCVQPDTRPGITINSEGVCSGCVGHEEKYEKINWDKRKTEFDEIIEKFRGRGKFGYDCLIPVSGGKDSTYQAYLLKHDYGMNPLCVTYKTPARTELGQKNLDNLVKLGFDHIDFTVNPETEKKFIYKALKRFGSVSLPFHNGMFAITIRTAINYGIPLIVWGENTAMEYGGIASDRTSPYMNKQWCLKYGCMQGISTEEWADENLTLKYLSPFIIPSDNEIVAAKISSIFLGYYFNWDPLKNYDYAKNLGFMNRPEGPVLGIFDFADLDCEFITLHHYVKWLKFGIGRTFDNVSVEIRNKRMTRDQAIKIISLNNDRINRSHLARLCVFLDITENDFWQLIENFRNHDIWEKNSDGKWIIPKFITGTPLYEDDIR